MMHNNASLLDEWQLNIRLGNFASNPLGGHDVELLAVSRWKGKRYMPIVGIARQLLGTNSQSEFHKSRR